MHKDPNIQELREYDAETAKYLRVKLFGDKPEKMEKWEKLFKDPIFGKKYQLSLD